MLSSDFELHNVHKDQLGRGLVYTDLAYYKNALKALWATAAGSASSEYFERHLYCGMALHELKKHATALEEFEKVLQCRPNKQQKADTQFYIGLTLYSLGRISKAEEEMEQTLKIWTKNRVELSSS